MSAEPSSNYDVLIAGGGMVGASLACALAQLPLRIGVVEPVPLSSGAQPSFDLRTTALSRTSQRILDSLGLWSEVASRAACIRRIHVSEQGRFGTTVIDAEQQAVPALGYVLENRVLGAAMWGRLEATDNVDMLCPATIDTATVADATITASLGGETFAGAAQARLLVVADGAGSRLRAALGVPAQTRSYEQTAIVGTVKVAHPGDGVTAFERFTPQGPMAMLPAGDGRYVFVLTAGEDAVAATLALDDGAFRDLLQARFGFRLGRIGRVGQRGSYPLALTCAQQLKTTRAAIVGNAAHGLHPVAGQGYNLGLRDAATLAELLADNLRSGEPDPGSDTLLAEYAAWREQDQRNVVAFTDGLVRGFELPAQVLGSLRGLGLAAFDVLPGAKTILAQTTMGLGGRQTRLARGMPL
jgi:2-octaprenyl-6-methoxyphenol hydroxylase